MDKHSDPDPGKIVSEESMDATQPADIEQPGDDRQFATISDAEDGRGSMRPGEVPQIEGYQITGKLGEGGMGIVYLAEQQRPVRRLVALKEIKPGMDSARIIARFEAEQQALPLMDHRQGHGKAAQPALRDSACVCRGHQPLSE